MTWGDVTETPSSGVGLTLGSYRLVQKLGEGGMGVVHLGLDAHGRAVAIKLLRAHIAYDPDARIRLGREVATLRRVRHPLVAEVLDADVDGDRPYVVTRYVPGPTLEAEVRERGPMPAAHLVRLGRGLSSALEAIHDAGVVHRDLKPGNVLILDGDPVLIDFGIAHVADDVRLTMTGLVMGTPGYLPPELIEGSAVTVATDWWGWAATLAFAASGQVPFGRGSAEAVIDRVRRGAADLSGVDGRLRPLLLAALSADPGARPEAPELLAALERFASGGLATVPVPVGPPTRSLASPTARVSTPPTKPYAGRPVPRPCHRRCHLLSHRRCHFPRRRSRRSTRRPRRRTRWGSSVLPTRRRRPARCPGRGVPARCSRSWPPWWRPARAIPRRPPCWWSLSSCWPGPRTARSRRPRGAGWSPVPGGATPSSRRSSRPGTWSGRSWPACRPWCCRRCWG